MRERERVRERESHEAKERTEQKEFAAVAILFSLLQSCVTLPCRKWPGQCSPWLWMNPLTGESWSFFYFTSVQVVFSWCSKYKKEERKEKRRQRFQCCNVQCWICWPYSSIRLIPPFSCPLLSLFSSLLFLFVLSYGLHDLIVCNGSVGAYFEKKFESHAIRKGDGIRLRCRALGEKPLTITWSKDRLGLNAGTESR